MFKSINSFFNGLFSKNSTDIRTIIKKLKDVDNNLKEKIYEGTSDFLANKISYEESQSFIVKNGVSPNKLNGLFEAIFSAQPNFVPRSNFPAIDSKGFMYVFLEKHDFETLMRGESVIRKPEEGLGKYFEAYDSPTIDAHSFARIKLKYKKGDAYVLEYKPQLNLYHLEINNFSLVDVLAIDRILPHGYLKLYQSKKDIENNQ